MTLLGNLTVFGVLYMVGSHGVLQHSGLDLWRGGAQPDLAVGLGVVGRGAGVAVDGGA